MSAVPGPVELGTPAPLTSLSFTLNGRPVEIAGASPLLSLNDWLRVQPGLTGTKKMCSEGGCGCCVVAVSKASLAQENNHEVLDSAGSSIAINSVSYLFIYLFVYFNFFMYTHICILL